METLLKANEWNIFLVFACTIFAVMGLCSTATLLKKKCERKVISSEESSKREWITIRSVLMGSMRWSGAKRWEDRRSCEESDLVGCESMSLGWQSHNSLSPVWQRPILMGEKCELPRHSGLILYDHNGTLLHPSFTTSSQNQGTQIDGGTKTTLRDLFYYYSH